MRPRAHLGETWSLVRVIEPRPRRGKVVAMIQRKSVGALAVASAVFVACGAGSNAPGGANAGPSFGGSGGAQPSGSVAGSNGTGASGPAGTGGTGMALPAGSVVTTCTPGIPVTTQVPRILNRQYDL